MISNLYTHWFQLEISMILISGYGRPHLQYWKGKLPQPSKVFDNKRPNNRTSSNLTTKVGREKVCGADIKPFHTRGSVQLIKYRSPITPTRDDFVLSINVFLWPLQWLRCWATFSFSPFLNVTSFKLCVLLSKYLSQRLLSALYLELSGRTVCANCKKERVTMSLVLGWHENSA